MDKHFFATLPHLQEVAKETAEMAWLIYDFVANPQTGRFEMKRDRIVYTKFGEALKQITTAKAGNVATFIKHLQDKLNEKLETPPTLGTPLNFNLPPVWCKPPLV